MPRRLRPALLLFIGFVAVHLCAAQDGTQNADKDAGEQTTPSEISDPALPVAAPAAMETNTSAAPLSPFPVNPTPRPSELHILGSQWKAVVPDVLQDQKRIWLFPLSVARGHHWKPALAVVGVTALLTTVDAGNAKWVRNNLQPLRGFNNAFAGYNTATATETFASAFYIAAIMRRNVYDQETFMKAGEAVIDSEILTTVMKDLDGREAPVTYPNGANFTDSWFKIRSGGWLGGLGSMPSGHEIAVMAVATVFAERYPHPAWHRWLAYSLAAAVGVSRVTLQSHFTSDTVAGGALGYVIARYLVLPRQPPN